MDAVRDIRWHSAKNRRKRQHKQELFAQKRAFLNRTPSHVLRPPAATLKSRANTFKPHAFLANIQRRSTPPCMQRQIQAMQRHNRHLTFHACMRMLQRGISLRNLQSSMVQVVRDDATNTIVTAYRKDSTRGMNRLHRAYAKLRPTKAQLRRHNLVDKPLGLSARACRDILAAQKPRITIKRLFHRGRPYKVLQVENGIIVGVRRQDT